MRYFRVLVLVLLAALWVVPAWGEITPDARRLMDEHRCLDGSTLTEVLQAAEPLGMKLVGAQIVTLDGGQNALRVEYNLVPADGDEIYTFFWRLDAQGRLTSYPISGKHEGGPRWGQTYLTAETAELGKACMRHNINEYYIDWNIHNVDGIGTDDPEEGKVTPAPEDPQIEEDPAILAIIPAHGFTGGVAELVQQAGLRLGGVSIIIVPPGRDDDYVVPGVYIIAGLEPTASATGEPPKKWFEFYDSRAQWRLARGSHTFEPLNDKAALLSAGILPRLVPRVH